MKTLPRNQANKLWAEYWREMRREWFKLEVLQDYMAEDDGPSLQAWLKGEHKMALELLKIDEEPEFTVDCRAKLAQGVKLLRVHILEEPLTPYMEWELEFYRQVSVPLRGEQVFVISKADTADLNIPAGDLVIFDQTRAVLNDYQNGLMINETFYDKQDDLSEFLVLRAVLIERAKALPTS